MTPAARHNKAAAVLLEALELQGAPRRSFLEQACSGDAELRAEVDRLLAEESCLAEGFLERPVLEALGKEFAGCPVDPEWIGPYRILGQLGEGGMGRVYRAEQIDPERRLVALKVLGAVLGPQARLRFQAECQALARLAHPNVASMYRTGSAEDGQLYVAMELIEGASVTAWCDGKRLGLRERVELFLGACAGVQHAHQKGILHRDLKPSNVLVAEIDGRPVAKVIDFGIARALDGPLVGEARLTRNQLLGSPAYMSPEAATLDRDVDTRADVYSLGVLLYELLAGVLPFDEESLPRLLRRIAEEERPAPGERLSGLGPPRLMELAEQRGLAPRALLLQLRGDLEAILHKALARAPEARYGSPAELAADLERHLQHKAIEARTPTKRYLLGRFLRRNAGTVAMLGVVLAALVGGLVSTTLEARRANREAQRTLDSLAEAHAVTRFMVDLFGAAHSGRSEALPLTTFELMQRAIERVDTDLAGHPLAQARILEIIGEIQTRVGLLESARGLISKALKLRQEGLAPDHLDVLASQRQLELIRKLQEQCGGCSIALPSAKPASP